MNSSGSTAAETAGDLAVLFHETYERLAPSFGYETRQETRLFDETSANGRLMVAVCEEVVGRFHAANQMEWHNALQTVPTIEHGWVLVAVRPHARDRYARAYVTIGAYSERRGWRGKFGPIEGEVTYWMDLPAYPETAGGQAYAIAVPAACHWQLCNETWVGDCGVLWEFADAGTPPEHRVNYCPRCGRGVVVEVPVEE